MATTECGETSPRETAMPSIARTAVPGLSQPSPRKYQREAISDVELALRSDRSRVQVLSLPTGAGKTHVALSVATRFLSKGKNRRVLWLAHRWELLTQVANRLKSDVLLANEIARIGGRLRAFPERHDAKFVFSTIQTWHTRRQKSSCNFAWKRNRLLVVVDECHWAAATTQGQVLTKQFLGKAFMLGLSATPHLIEETHAVAYQKTFADLCPKYLAVPIVHVVPTGEFWNPIIKGEDVSLRSLRELGNRTERNRLIVKTFLEGHHDGSYTRTVIFACDIAHANELNRKLSCQGVECRAVHSAIQHEQNTQSVQDFRRGKVRVLVAVGMLTEGMDVPEIDTIFLTRPTSSLTLLAQMIGRGARKTSGKRRFQVVEFTDSVGRLGKRLFHSNDYLCHKSSGSSRMFPRANWPRRHGESEDAPKFESLSLDSLEGIPFVRDQTFGVEMEISTRDGSWRSHRCWSRNAARIIGRLEQVASLPVHEFPLQYHENNDPTLWRVCHDGSCGWEVVSPILENASGFEELVRVATAINAFVRQSPALCVNARTGLHVTLATRLNLPKHQRGFLRRLSRLEAGLYTLVAPSRLYRWGDSWTYRNRYRNLYCKPIRESKDKARWENYSRTHSVNLQRMADGVQLLEVRMHHGTTDYKKIVTWIALWMQIFNHSRYEWSGPRCSDRVLANGNRRIAKRLARAEDIFALLRNEGITLPAELHQMLWQRRKHLKKSWLRAVPNRVRAWERAGWYDPPDLHRHSITSN
ncbi:DEAD/DEAH box helicase [Roseiconus nitratireducens]|uniref:DEAD/DEAH box helicase n=1 Tax=Roseiconus nitratireducens TaxID=2605748 RepID=A0A5M6D8W7_9BACT|nr:DEAD/DEAH box helicase family protein [Roseiconus nitratireducens]KAA5543076.1 DEAD/DEAH box helicase [Roseiconus nitratireducens]